MSDKSNVRGRIIDIPIRIVLYLYSMIVIFPLVWTVYTSFKENKEFYDNPWSLPKGLNFVNYANAFEKAKMGDYFLNSIVVTIASIVLIVIFSLVSAYAIARFKNSYTVFLHNLYMAGLFVPAVLGLVPLFLLLNKISLLDKLSGLTLVYVGYSLSFSIYVLVGFLKSIAKEYEEAAYIDGCSYMGTLVKIIAPMAKPAIITIVVFNFLSLWNEYIFALVIVVSDAKRTLPVGLAYLMETQRYSTDWGALFAGLVIVMVPTLICYCFLQKKIMAGLNMGGLKG